VVLRVVSPIFLPTNQTLHSASRIRLFLNVSDIVWVNVGALRPHCHPTFGGSSSYQRMNCRCGVASSRQSIGRRNAPDGFVRRKIQPSDGSSRLLAGQGENTTVREYPQQC
jgi:hypothetical protein